MRNVLFLAFILVILVNCSQNSEVTDITQFPRMKVNAVTVNENDALAKVPVVLTWAYPYDVKVNFSTKQTEAASAIASNDYTTNSGTITIASGDTIGFIEIAIKNDNISESTEKFEVVISDATNAKIISTTSLVTILDDDTAISIDGTGFVAPEAYQGYTKVWEENFDSEGLNGDIWKHEIGGGGWGNNELQYYSDSPENSFTADGFLIIEAKKQNVGGREYSSARIVSKDKYNVKYGRIDIRAKLPEGKGIWPALWMLGSNIDQVNWPRCGEIDIMELIGNQPQIVHGTAHYSNTANAHEFKGASTFLSGGKKFSEEFHVFSLVWKENSMQWLMDNKVFHTLTPANTNGSPWPFNDSFFFIMNVAVGGNWPGTPNATTVFPQRMFVDYIRLYQ